jgi:hypothetical protein
MARILVAGGSLGGLFACSPPTCRGATGTSSPPTRVHKRRTADKSSKPLN